MTLAGKLLAGGILVVSIYVMRMAGIGPGDLWQAGEDRLKAFRDDSVRLTTGEYKAQVAERLRQEAAQIGPADQANDKRDEMRRELDEARRKMLEERAAAFEQQKANLLRGDVDSLRRQVEENARRAGGGQ